MSRIIIISNLLPLGVTRSGKQQISLFKRAGGFQSGLRKFYEKYDVSWIGWTGVDKETFSEAEIEETEKLLGEQNCFPVHLLKKEREQHLDGFCNNTLWPVFHYFPQHAVYDEEHWKSYSSVNMKYAEKIGQLIKEGDIIWIHDFHLILLPGILRKYYPDLSVGYFQHIPFPSFEIFRLIPWRTDLLDGLLGSDLIAFHTYDYERHFLSCVRRLAGLDTYFNQVRLEKRVLKVENFPMGIDFDKFHEQSQSLTKSRPEDRKLLFSKIDKHIRQDGKVKIILSIDRLDYTKGIANRILALRCFLSKYPQYLEKVTLLMFVVPSKENMAEYKKLKCELDELVGRTNSEFGTISWRPVVYFYRSLEFDDLTQVYVSCDIALVTPLRDGMNLIAKEFIASKHDQKGMLILSEMAGASKEMGEAIIVNPNNINEMAEAIKTAIEIPGEEQISLNTVLQKRLKHYNQEKWANDFLDSLMSVKKIQEFNLTRKLSLSIRKDIFHRYNSASKRLFLLDYDGTLQGFFKDPQKAKPDEELYQILENLINDKRNKVVIISGRDKETLTEWFPDMKRIDFIAEHGVWRKGANNEWVMPENIDKKWMEIIRPHLEFFVDRTPRSFIEDKNYSLVWHYRKADPDLGLQRAFELKDELTSLVSNLQLEIMDGDKVIEIKNAGINKGRAALTKLRNKKYDFIIAFGDDWTDEYTFDALPDKAITVKVGEKRSKARYFVESYLEVRGLLEEMVEERD